MTRIALVTGGTRGIGAETCKLLKEKGYRPLATYTGNEEAALRFHTHTQIPIYKWDISDYEACAHNIQCITQDVGPIDILVNNAGIIRDAFLHKMSLEQWTKVVNTNLNGLFNMCRPLIGGMRERGFGRIICISSINGQKGQVGQTNYSAAKAGELGFVKALALENATKGITVNAICPGYIETDMTRAVPQEVIDQKILPLIPVGRMGQPFEIARCVLFLASEEAGFITGSTLSVNGGQYMEG